MSARAPKYQCAAVMFVALCGNDRILLHNTIPLSLAAGVLLSHPIHRNDFSVKIRPGPGPETKCTRRIAAGRNVGWAAAAKLLEPWKNSLRQRFRLHIRM